MIYTLPQAGESPIIAFIQEAKGPLEINVYYLSDRKILQVIHGTVEQGKPVFVIVDGHPFGMSEKEVQKEIKNISETGADVKIAPPQFEGSSRFDHAKYSVAGNEALIGSANWSWSAFHHNRDYLITTSNQDDISTLHQIFKADWNGSTFYKSSTMPKDLVISPGSLTQIEQIIEQPGAIEVETEELGDAPKVLNALEQKGHQASIILPSTISNADQQRANEIAQYGVNVRFMPKETLYMHAKAIIGENEAFIGSQNFSDTSLMINREVGIILTNKTDINHLSQQFQQDWNQSTNTP